MADRNIKNSTSLRRLLISLNNDVDALKRWVMVHGHERSPASFTVADLQAGRIPQIVTDILILEDRRFMAHRGFELKSIARGMKRRLNYGRFGGISTIDQLLVRTCFKRTERTFRRKGREVALAFILNMHCEKEEILAAFVKSAYFGPRLNGADTAAQVIFRKRAVDLQPHESAFIASLLPYPLPPRISFALRSLGAVSHPNVILNACEAMHPWWVERVRMRMAYLEALRPKYSTTVL